MTYVDEDIDTGAGLRRRRTPQPQGGDGAEAEADVNTTSNNNTAGNNNPPPSPHWTHQAMQSPPGGKEASPNSSSIGPGAAAQDDIGLVDKSFRYVSAGAFLTWLALVTIIHRTGVVPDDNFVALEGWERTAPGVACAVLCVSTLSWILPLLYRGGFRGRTRVRKSGQLSGILIGGLTVQTIALLTEWMMFAHPTPVMVDPVLGGRVYLLRWCEWTPLAFLMTFLTEATDVQGGGEGKPQQQEEEGQEKGGASGGSSSSGGGGGGGWKSLRVPVLHAACQGLSTLCGLLFPFCPTAAVWYLAMAVSCALFVVIYFRLAYKRRMFRGMDRGTTVEDVEAYARGRLSLGLLWTCTVLWTVLVVAYFFYSLAPLLLEGVADNPASWFRRDGPLTMACEATLDGRCCVVSM